MNKIGLAAPPRSNNSENNDVRSVYLFIFLLISSPIIAEIIRKYAIYTNIIFIALNLTLIAIAIRFLITKAMYIHEKLLVATVAVLCTWCLVHVSLAPSSMLIFLIGLSTYLIPFFGTVISIALFASASQRAAFAAATIFQIAGLTLAVLQIALGPSHWVNFVPLDLNPAEAHYGEIDDQASLFGLFRPMSLYMHTGKFGQIVFILFLFRAFFLLREEKGRMLTQFTLIDAPALIVSGQRSAMVLAAAIFVILFIKQTINGAPQIRHRMLRHSLFLAALIVTVGAFVTSLGFPLLDLLSVFGARFESSFPEIASRTSYNVAMPFTRLLDIYPVLGEGVGRYSFGAQRILGDDPRANEYLFTAAENTWLRTMAEIGGVGMAIFSLMLLAIVVRSISVSGSIINETCFFVLAMALWANTHDVFANFVGMWLGFMLLGSPPVQGQSTGRGASESEARTVFIKSTNSSHRPLFDRSKISEQAP